MTFVITQNCCTDASCVSVCPVNCIHPTPDEPDYATADQLYIDAAACIDCGACADACPTDAIAHASSVEGTRQSVFLELGRTRFEQQPAESGWAEPVFPVATPTTGTPRVAVVGTGPAAAYATEALLRSTDAEVTLIERLPMPGGLVRAGVAPDHQKTRGMAQVLGSLFPNPRLSLVTNLEVGRDLRHADLLEHHHAVVYAVGAPHDRRLGIEGEDLAGSVAATSVVRWYNADPLTPTDTVDLSCERVLVAGSGNVALDIGRVLTVDPDRLAHTDIADHALEALRHSHVREVVLLGRRGPEDAAWTTKEIVAMRSLAGVDVVVADVPGVREAIESAAPGSKASRLQGLPFVAVDAPAPSPATAPRGPRRIVLRFHGSVTSIEGGERVEKALVRSTGPDGEVQEMVVTTGLVVRAIGHEVAPVPDLPFDLALRRVPHEQGRVLDGRAPLTGAYLVGWVKRGPSGGIGANRGDADETVRALAEDLGAGRLDRPVGSSADFNRLVRRVAPQALRLKDVQDIDRAEVRRGRRAGRPRVKHASVEAQVADRKRRFRR